MEIREITLERKGEGGQCGTLAFRDGARTGWLLFVVQWQRGQKVTVEFVPGLGAHQADVAKYHDRFVDEVVKTVFDQVSRKKLFRS
jgi:hypothetical protein